MVSLYLVTNILILAIGIYMVSGHYKNGWMTPPVLSGIAFILLVAPSFFSTF